MTAPRARWRDAVQRWKQWPAGARWSAVVAGLLVAAVAAAAGIVPGVVRSAVTARAERRGFRAEVGSVRLGLGRVWLRDVVVSDAKLPALRAELDAVAVAVSPFGVSGVRVYGGRVRAAASRAALLERWRALRAGDAEPSAERDTDADGRGRTLELEGIDLSFRPDDGNDWSVWGLAARELEGGGSRWTADVVRGRQGAFAAEIRALEVDVGGGRPRRLMRVEAVTATARWAVGANGITAQEAVSGAVPAPAPAQPQPQPQRVEPEPSAFSAAAWAALREAVGRVLGPRFQGSVVAVSVDVERDAESLRLGPSRVVVAREADQLSLEMVPHAAGQEAGTPLRLGAKLTLSSGAAEVALSGGPVRLSALGIREGDFGLVGVRDARLDAEAQVRLDPTRADVELTSRGRLENARLFRPALAAQELSGIRLGWRVAGSARLDGTRLVLRDAELSIGEVRAELAGEIERTPERTHVALRTAVPLAACGAVLDALPRGAAPLLDGVVLDGTFALDSRVEYDSARPAAATAHLNVKNDCRVKAAPETIAPQRFRSSWRRDVKAADGSPVTIESGPGSPDWTPYEDISQHMETAVIVCEDEGFFLHRGFAYRSIESSIRQNLAAGRFLRGASTVSMQLAKNLYLGKEKTLSRKLQEAVLTLLLEQELSKHELMELYLNVIEFGPGIYGIRQAARYYFNEEPRNLSLGQALYLGSILPSPDSHHFLPDGRVSAAWTRYLQKLMQIAHKIRRISDEELAEGLEEQVAFRKPNLLGDAIAPVNDSAEEEIVPELTP